MKKENSKLFNFLGFLKKIPAELVVPYILVFHCCYPIINLVEVIFFSQFSREVMLSCLLLTILLFILALLSKSIYNLLLSFIYSDNMTSNANHILSGLYFVSKYPTISAIFVSSVLILQLVVLNLDLGDSSLYFCRVLFTAIRNLFLFPGLGYLFIYYWNQFNLEDNFYADEIDLKNQARLEKYLRKTSLFSKTNPSFNQIRNYGFFARAIQATINITSISNAAGRTALVTAGGSAVAAVTAGGFEADQNIKRITNDISNINRNLPETTHSALKQVSMSVEAEAQKSLNDFFKDGGSGLTIKGVNRIFGVDKVEQPLARTCELAQAEREINILAQTASPEKQLEKIPSLCEKFNLPPIEGVKPVVSSFKEFSFQHLYVFLISFFNG